MDHRIWHSSYAPGVPASINFDDHTIVDFLHAAARNRPDTTAVIFQNCRLSYRTLDAHVQRLAAGLAGLGVGPGDRVAIQLPNLPQTVIAFYAVLRLRACAVMTNPLYVEREIEHQWNDAGCSVAIVADFLFASRVRDMRHELSVEHFVTTSIPDFLRFPLKQIAPFALRRRTPPAIAKIAPEPGVHDLRDLMRGASAEPDTEPPSNDDLAVLQYTGGTTGVSKAAMLTHRNLSYNVQQIEAWFPGLEQGREVFLAAPPFFHVFGLTVSLNLPVRLQSGVVLITDPRDIGLMIRSIAKHRVTVFPGVPAMYNAINHAEEARSLDLTSVKACVSGSAPLPGEVASQFAALTGAELIEGYGLTETSPVTHANPIGAGNRIGTIGLPIPETDARIVDPSDPTVDKPQGEEGELLIRGPQVMAGYWNKPQETERALHDGWFATGDIARMDEDGYFAIVGRKKDMILASGYNIYPDEVDAVLMTHPAVREAATIGVPDPKRGETVKSFVVLRRGASLTAQQLIDYARENLAAYKAPRAIEFRDSLPKSTVLKVLRRQLREEELAKVAKAGSSPN